MSILLLNQEEMKLIQERLLAQVLEQTASLDNLMLVGIERRGADLAKRFAQIIEEKKGIKVPHGKLDINLYRDDWTLLKSGSPQIGQSDIPLNPDGKTILLIDDVLFSGRTVRAALEALLDYGRPDKVELLVLIDRGHRELPIHANYIGRYVDTQKDAHIDVLLEECDGQDAVILTSSSPESYIIRQNSI